MLAGWLLLMDGRVWMAMAGTGISSCSRASHLGRQVPAAKGATKQKNATPPPPAPLPPPAPSTLTSLVPDSSQFFSRYAVI